MTDAELYTLDSIGLVVVRGALNRDAVSTAGVRIAAALESAVAAKIRVLDLDDVFLHLMNHPWILAACERTLRGGWCLDEAFACEQRAEDSWSPTEPVPRTCVYRALAGSIHVGRLAVCVALTGQSPDTGGFAYVPGTHKRGNLTISDVGASGMFGAYADDDLVNIPELRAGDIYAFPISLRWGNVTWRRFIPRRVVCYIYRPTTAVPPAIDAARGVPHCGFSSVFAANETR